MQVRNIVLSTSAAVILGALVVLFVKVQDSPAADVPEQSLAEARQRHERAKSLRASRSGSSSTPRTLSPSRPMGKELPPRAPEPQPPKLQPRDDAPKEARPPKRSASAFVPEMTDSPLERGKALKERMDEANRLYDRREYEAAMQIAKDILAESPRNVRMIRVVVSSACMMGDGEVARTYFDELPTRDKRQMRVRCERYGVELPADTE